MHALADIWKNLCRHYVQEEERIQELWEEIDSAYSRPGRYYHSLDHLAYMIDLALLYQGQVQDFDSLLFAIFYHDYVYNTIRQDNEARSAAVAEARLTLLGYPEDARLHCSQMILATRTHQGTGDPDTNLLLDIDLAILGAPPEAYQAYARNVRREYAQYPAFLYRKGRRKFLRELLEQKFIFHTPGFRKQLESQARVNMQKECEGK